ncbi:hypothetical protein [Salinarchaeum laminariae]|nr:hypothetical protein [Salinarchaeum laminariae]
MSSRIAPEADECGRCGATEGVRWVGCRCLCPECRQDQRDAAEGPLS